MILQYDLLANVYSDSEVMFPTLVSTISITSVIMQQSTWTFTYDEKKKPIIEMDSEEEIYIRRVARCRCQDVDRLQMSS